MSEISNERKEEKIIDTRIKAVVKQNDCTHIVPVMLLLSNSILVTQSSMLHVIPAQSHSLMSLKKRCLELKGGFDPHWSDPSSEHCDQSSPFVA